MADGFEVAVIGGFLGTDAIGSFGSRLGDSPTKNRLQRIVVFKLLVDLVVQSVVGVLGGYDSNAELIA